jgi:hypothetical protein
VPHAQPLPRLTRSAGASGTLSDPLTPPKSSGGVASVPSTTELTPAERGTALVRSPRAVIYGLSNCQRARGFLAAPPGSARSAGVPHEPVGFERRI